MNVTHECWKEPEKQITVVLLIDGYESRVAANVGRVRQTSHLAQHFCLVGQVVINKRCEKELLSCDASDASMQHN